MRPTVKYGVLGSKLFIKVGRNGFSASEIIGDLNDVRALRDLEVR